MTIITQDGRAAVNYDNVDHVTWFCVESPINTKERHYAIQAYMSGHDCDVAMQLGTYKTEERVKQVFYGLTNVLQLHNYVYQMPADGILKEGE